MWLLTGTTAGNDQCRRCPAHRVVATAIVPCRGGRRVLVGESASPLPRWQGGVGISLCRHLDPKARDIRTMKAVVSVGADRCLLDGDCGTLGRPSEGPARAYTKRGLRLQAALFPVDGQAEAAEITQRAARDCRGLRHEGAGALAWSQ